MQYDPSAIEEKWREWWKANDIYKVVNDSSKPKYYVLDMFPYPSGAGLHVGHPLGYVASDILARQKRMDGYNVLHPMGFDAFGLPAEQYAVETGVHPSVSTAKNIVFYRQQLDNLGLSYDWSRQVDTSDPRYFKWTQWIFLQLFGHYYDNAAQKAKPIADLLRHFEQQGTAGLDAACSEALSFSAAEWQQMGAKAKDEVLMNYRLAYRRVSYVNWCEALGTILANDEVKDGLSERGGHPVLRRPMLQWAMRITAYAERLLKGLDALNWPESLKVQQRNWVGRSEGARAFFRVQGSDAQIEIFTTRPDTIFGATFMVLAPEHELVASITTPAQQGEVDAYLAYAQARSERERMADTRHITGAFTGAFAINPLTEQPIPIWIADYVLKDYGTGAIMAVPSDDERDQRFAQHFGLPIVEVVDKSDYPGAGLHDKLGKMINSGFVTGMEVPQAIEAVIQKLEALGIGTRQVNYKLRDANLGRQRYWGEPFPIVYDAEGVAHALDLADLPLELPHVEDFKPASGGKSPLARAEDWCQLPDGRERETDTMPGFAGSSWYFLRYMDPDNDSAFASPEALAYWQDVDLYIGGAEHAVGHLLYARMWHRVLYDLGLVPTEEPFKKLINQGMIQGVIEYLYLAKNKDAEGRSVFVSADLLAAGEEADYARLPVYIKYVKQAGQAEAHLDAEGLAWFKSWRPEYADAEFRLNAKGQLRTHSEVGKMSKRYHNVINPDEVIAQYGADAFRMYEMFLGPIEQSKPFDLNGINGVSGFLKKFWALFFPDGNWAVEDSAPSREEWKVLHTCIQKVREDVERFSMNTCVSAFMIAVNDLKRLHCHKRAILEPLVCLLAPFAVYLSEELWQRLGGPGSVHLASYPQVDPRYLVEDSVEYPVSINGKKRASISAPTAASVAEVEALALANPDVQKWTDGQAPKRIIVVPGRMVNIVV